MISIDIYPNGWDKRYCLRYFPDRSINFYGDRTEPGGNDHLLYIDPRVHGYSVNGPSDIQKQLQQL